MAETILIVDDDSSLRTLVACALDQAGFDTIEAAASEEALDLLDGTSSRSSSST